MKTLTLDLEQLTVDSFSAGGPGLEPLTGDGGSSEFTICTACPTNAYSCLETCGLKCQLTN